MTIPDGIFKAYDIRGLYPQELDEAAAERIGCALAQQLGASRLGAGMDPRPSSAGLLEAFAAGAAAGRRRRPSTSASCPRRCSTSASPRAGSTAAPWSPPRTTRRSTTA